MEVIVHHFCNPFRLKKNHEIKKMMTTSIFKRQAWMADDYEFDYLVKNSQRILGSKFSVGDIWNLFQEPNNTSNFYRQMINRTGAWNYIQKSSDSPLGTEITKQTHKIIMEHRKDTLSGEYRKSSVFFCTGWSYRKIYGRCNF